MLGFVTVAVANHRAAQDSNLCEAAMHQLSVYVSLESSSDRVEVQLSEASLECSSLEIASDMFDPLFLPLGVDLHRSEQSTLLHV